MVLLWYLETGRYKPHRKHNRTMDEEVCKTCGVSFGSTKLSPNSKRVFYSMPVFERSIVLGFHPRLIPEVSFSSHSLIRQQVDSHRQLSRFTRQGILFENCRLYFEVKSKISSRKLHNLNKTLLKHPTIISRVESIFLPFLLILLLFLLLLFTQAIYQSVFHYSFFFTEMAFDSGKLLRVVTCEL